MHHCALLETQDLSSLTGISCGNANKNLTSPGHDVLRSANDGTLDYRQKDPELLCTSREDHNTPIRTLPFYEPLNSTEGLRSGDVKVIQSLGYGAFSKVEEIWHIATNVRLARKTVRSSTDSGSQYLALEATVLRQLRHRHIVRLIGTFSQSGETSIFLSPVAETNLAEYLATSGAGASESRLHIRGFFGCLVSALRHTHESSFTHGDIKPANILVSKDRIPSVLLCDFGASRSQFDIQIARGSSRPFTWRYRAPETVSCARRGRRADVFSLGCVFLEMAATLWLSPADELPQFRNSFKNKTYYQEISQALSWLAKMDERASMLDRNILRTIAKMMSETPRDRPTSSDLSLVFQPRACCEAWPSTETVTISSFEALYALSCVKHQLEIIQVGLNHIPTSMGYGSYITSFSPALSSELLIAEGLLDLALQRNRTIREASHNFSLISRWLEICTSTHSDCISNDHSTWLPSRLIDVGLLSNCRHTTRLVITAEEKLECSRYVALSHVWRGAGDDKARLTKSSLSQLQYIIFPQALPVAIQDAIMITRQLGERYLWVDSLCIVHDSQDDWEREGAARASIYRNAFVTIAITSSSSTDLKGQWSLCPFDPGASLSPILRNRSVTTLGDPIRHRKLLQHHGSLPPLFFGKSSRGLGDGY
jgi:serine/threonine protein kinase